MVQGRTKKVFNNIAMSFFNKLVIIILGFLSRTIFINVLGTELLGVNGLFSDVLSWLSMADLGFSTAMAYSFYKPIAENDTKKISALINFYKKIYRIIALSVTVIGLTITPFLDVIINSDKEIPLLKIYYLFALGGVIISYLFVYKTSIITADQNNYIVIRINMIINFTKIILQILVLLLFRNYIAYLTINLIGNFLANYIASKKAVKLYPYINEKYELSKEEKKSMFKNIKSIFLYKLSSLLLNATDNTLISMLIGINAVGIYSNYLMISTNIMSIIQVIFGALTASIGNVIVKEKSRRRYEIFRSTQYVSFIICGIVVTCFSLLVNDFITVWLGVKYIFNNFVVIVIALNMYLSCILQPLWTYREATGLYVKTKYIMIIAALVNLVLSIILGRKMGIGGILLASILAKLTTYFWYEPTILFKEYFNESVKKYYIPILKNAAMMIVCIILLKFMFSRFNVISWIDLFIKSAICFSITICVFLAMYIKDEGFGIIKDKIKRIKTIA